ncbi:PqqD family peptide modification chaperone [Terriglobus tenax]|uniref:PqqD family peptide modification chaperone n=1 Tax=Terriglobus tenax TaxID=1111115 RepID=UPI0021E04060|nr:PqqD family peptide modification chaperone [Terriglobus tenax]
MTAETIPQMTPGYRLHPTQDVVLIPEGALELSGPTRDILLLVDGTRSVKQIVHDLAAQYAGVDENEMLGDVIALLGRLAERGVLQG